MLRVFLFLRPLNTPQDRRRKQNKRPNESERTIDGNSEQSERKKEQPDERIQEERSQSYRPADHKQKKPQKELCHG